MARKRANAQARNHGKTNSVTQKDIHREANREGVQVHVSKNGSQAWIRMAMAGIEGVEG